jgi:hypothetical protein
VNVELTADNFYFEIKEIKFLRNNTDEKADLNTLDVRKKEFRFTNEYFDQTATNRLNQTIEGLTFEGLWFDIDHEQGTVSLNFKVLYLDKYEPFNEFGNAAMAGEIIFPESVTLQYYQNRELKTGEFKITNIFASYFNHNYEYKLIIKTNFHIESDNFLLGIVYVEGTKVCEIRDYDLYYIPSTCEEIYTNLELDGLTINYNGTMTEFRNIKGAEDLISHWENIEKAFQIVCTDGTISLSVN